MERVDGEMMAAALAAAGEHRTHPNPRVGAVVVARDGQIAGWGGHAGPGSAHAEALALSESGPLAEGSTLYVTLEPCAHVGKTPPCTEAIIAAGVARVVVAQEDPDPRVAGRGVDALRRSGIEVVTGVCREEALNLDPGYFHHRTTGRPRVTLKVAMTLDGQIAAADGSSQWITSVEARRDAHHLRSSQDAVMVGAGTLLADDPALTVRLDGFEGPQPLPVIVAGRRPVPSSRRVFEHPALVFSPIGLDLPAKVVVVPDASGEKVDLIKMLENLGSRGVVDLLVEGGSSLATAFWGGGLVDHGVVYAAAGLAGGIGRGVFDGVFAAVGDLQPVRITGIERIGPDVRIDFEGVA
jgi:diaminohydroxyphosphoribosylaminopyrimidine deaminase/5-amino-6-(5-phosphoribosylamino)uracil reductase